MPPDVAFVAAARLTQEPAAFFVGAPDLAVEVVFPSDGPIELRQRVQEYLAGGTRLVWVVDPSIEMVTVYAPRGAARMLHRQDMLSGEDVLPGFTLRVGNLWRQENSTIPG